MSHDVYISDCGRGLDSWMDLLDTHKSLTTNNYNTLKITVTITYKINSSTSAY
jgi:hypothetical protein